MKYFIFPLLTILLIGCFGGGQKDESVISPNDTKFALGETVWKVSLLEGWEKIENLPNPNTIYTAKKETQNFMIHQYPGKGGNIAEYFYNSAKDTFFYFEGLGIEGNKISFKAQSQAASPLRTYHQKIVEIPGLPTYLIGSCSHESQHTPDECQKLLDLWMEVVEEE